MTASSSQGEFVVGVMSIDVEGKNSDRFHRLFEQAVQAFDDALAQALGLRVHTIAFPGPHVAPTAGAYAPFDFLRIGLTVLGRTERRRAGRCCCSRCSWA